VKENKISLKLIAYSKLKMYIKNRNGCIKSKNENYFRNCLVWLALYNAMVIN
jgi:hypothetical protein